MKRFFLIIATFLFHIVGEASQKAFEIDLAQLLPEQSPLKSLVVEADNFQAEVLLNDGTCYDYFSGAKMPDALDLWKVTLAGADVRLHLITKDGSDLPFSLYTHSSFSLFMRPSTDGVTSLSIWALHLSVS